MSWFTIECATREASHHPEAEALRAALKRAGVDPPACRFVQKYAVETDDSFERLAAAAASVFADSVIEKTVVGGAALPAEEESGICVEVWKKPGVMDPVEASARLALSVVGIKASAVHTARKFVFPSGVPEKALAEAAAKSVANPMIEEVRVRPEPGYRASIPPTYEFCLVTVPIRSANDAALEKISRDGVLSLNLDEMRAIQARFGKEGRDPTDAELATLAQTWSEHCVHKTLKGGSDFRGHEHQNILKETVFAATDALKKPWCVSVFKDNAGVIDFDEKTLLCFKVETHNHPSALEPYGGAATGVGGVLRDPMGTGRGAKPVLNTDVFCFAPPDTPDAAVPAGALHPKRIFEGVVSGVRDYGNRMGVPTANGAIVFHEGFLGNPLVFCGTVGILPKGGETKEVKAGDKIVVCGGRTGRDGIHGATFSSQALTSRSVETSSGAVQIGNAITEKRLLDSLLQARDLGLYRAITDCGAGGLSSAVGEMGEKTGAEVHLERVPLKYAGLSYTEIWISEAQERMVLAVPPEDLERLLSVLRAEGNEATDIGTFTGDGRLRLFYGQQQVADLGVDFLHEGVPLPKKKARWSVPTNPEPDPATLPKPGRALRRILGTWTACSKEWVVRQYDHEVQGRTVVKPFAGPAAVGPSDAVVFLPRLDSERAAAVGCGLNPRFGLLDPYAGAASAVDEAIRNVVAVGADPEQTSLLDNFCYGNPDDPEVMGSIVLAAEACRDAALAYGAPFISGKDSLHNEYRHGDARRPIPPTLLASALAIVPDVRKAVTMDLKKPGNPVFLVGPTRDELGGSLYYSLVPAQGQTAPQVDFKLSKKTFKAIHRAIQAGIVASCHDLSDGGLAAAAAEMAIASGLGLSMALSNVPRVADLRDDVLLFSESNGRFLVEVKSGQETQLQSILAGIPNGRVGTVTDAAVLEIRSAIGGPLLEEKVADLAKSWREPLYRLFGEPVP
ncbi:MAG: phosphoribosylformylglycinamidine synthase subunit PurL [Planctomycetota bacterium]